MSDYNLGTARGVIEIDYRGQGATQASRDLKNVGSTAEDSARRTGRAGTAMMAAGAVIAAGLGFAVKSAADFEKQLSNVAAVSGATESEMEGIRNKALQLGKDTQFSASESAQAIEELVKAGLTVQDVMNGAADATVNLAAAGEVSMPEAATIASNAMNQFNLSAKDMVGVADSIAGAANASAIDVSEFGMSLSQVGAVANLAGANFEDTATAIALMGNAGIKGSDAGTSLKSMLMNLQPTTDKQKDLFNELGLAVGKSGNAFYDAEGNLKSLADVSGVLGDSLEGMSKKQKQATLEVLFGSDGIRAAAILANEGAKGFDKMAASMGKVSAADVAATKMDNFAGSVEQLKGSLETLMIQVGTPLLGLLRYLVDGLTAVTNVVLNMDPAMLGAITTFAALLSMGLLLVGGFLKLRSAIILMQAGFLLFTLPIIAVIAAIAALVAAFVYFYKTNSKFRAFVQEMAAVLKEMFGDAIEWLIPKLKEFAQFLTEVFQASLPYIRQFGAFLVAAFQAIMPHIQAFLQFVGELADVFVSDVLPIILDVADAIINSLVAAFKSILPEIMPLLAAVGDFAVSLFGLADAIYTRLQPAITFLIAVFKILIQTFVSTVMPLILRLGKVFATVFIGVIGNAVRTALAVIRNVLAIISGVIKVFTGLLTGDFGKAWEGVKQIFRGAAGVIMSIMRGMMRGVGILIRGIGQALLAGVRAIPGLLKGAGGLFLAAGRFLIDQFVQGIKNAAGLIEGIASNVWNFVRGLINGAINQINAALEFTIDPPGPGSVHINPADIPGLATGGVLSAPTLSWIAEGNDDEAVVPLRSLWRQMDRVYKAGRTGLGDPESGSGARRGGLGGTAQPGRSRLVEGRLYIDASGHAYIRGVAQDVYDDNDDQEHTMSRMSGRR